MDVINWAVKEFVEAELGDNRRTDRLVYLASKIVGSPECSLSSAMGNEADNKAAQRFFGNDRFDYQDIISPVIENTLSKCKDVSRILFIQDTSHLNYDAHKATLGLGHIGTVKDKSFQGIMMHWTLALDSKGECLGVSSLKLWEREPEPRKIKKNEHQSKPIEQKESFKWIEALETIGESLHPEKQAIWIADREADIYDFIDGIMSQGHDFVIRSNVNRVVLDEEGLLKERIRSAPVRGVELLQLNKPINGVSEIEVEISCCDISLMVQRRKGGAKSSRICKDRDIYAVRISPRDLHHDFEWILLTSLPAESLEECLEIIWLYKQRWHIESVHKTLKSGFQAEDLRLNNVAKLKKAITLMLPCAVQVYWMTHMQKYYPEKPASMILNKTECSIISRINKKKSDYIPTIKEAWLWIGYLGGFRGSKNSSPPGQITFWRGLKKVKNMVEGVYLMLGDED